MKVHNLDNLPTLPISQLLETQGELKDLTEANYKKLKASIEKHGFNFPIATWVDTSGEEQKYYIIDGHQRKRVILKEYGDVEVPVFRIHAETLKEAAEILAKVTSQYGTITQEGLDQFIATYDLPEAEIYEATHFDALTVYDTAEPEQEVEEDEAPEVDESEPPKSKLGEIYQLGRHRVMCGDSTDKANVELLMNGEKADMVFTDPPYGMGKEKDGVLNDNFYGDKLLEFNRKWVPLSFEQIKENGSWYCWGIDEPLMDIYVFILKPMIKKNKVTFRNLITWDKGNGQGQRAEGFRSYAVADEKCLFVMCGVQGFNTNQDNYYEGWEPIRKYLEGEKNKMGWTDKWIATQIGVDPRLHWFGKSQWDLPTREKYEALQQLAQGDAFKKDYDEIKKDYDRIRKEWQETRAYFDNTHDNMNNVWHFQRHKDDGDEGNHATPKPIELCSRAIRSSSREDEIVLDLFGGSGSTLIACEQTDRTCYGMELDEKYCDVIRKRYAKFVSPDNQLPENWEELTAPINTGK